MGFDASHANEERKEERWVVGGGWWAFLLIRVIRGYI